MHYIMIYFEDREKGAGVGGLPEGGFDQQAPEGVLGPVGESVTRHSMAKLSTTPLE